MKSELIGEFSMTFFKPSVASYNEHVGMIGTVKANMKVSILNFWSGTTASTNKRTTMWYEEDT
jgi:hypothetical protein